MLCRFEQESEESSSEEEGAKPSGKRGAEVKNMPFDEALDVSASLDASQAAGEAKKDKEVKNMPFDEALEVSASMSQAAGAQPQVIPRQCLCPPPTAHTCVPLLRDRSRTGHSMRPWRGKCTASCRKRRPK